jgi:hypothetical protein
MYDFSTVKAASVGNYLEPGIYKLKVKEAKAVSSTTNKTPGLAVTFENKEGQTVTETFYVTEKSVDRLQYFHTAFLGKELASKFKNEEEIISYFVKTLTGKRLAPKTILVGGNISDSGRVFSQLPYSGFVIEDENVELGAFDTDSKEYKKYVTASNLKSEVAGKKNGILNDTDENEEEIGKSKKDKPATKTITKATGKKPKDEEVEEEEEKEEGGDDLDW